MILKLRKNLSGIFENFTVKKIIKLQNLLSIYEENKKIILSKKEELLKTFNNYVKNTNIQINFNEKIDMKYIEELVEKLEKLYEDKYLNRIESDISNRFIDKLKKIIKFINLLYVSFMDIILNYNSALSYKQIGRAPPLIF